MSLGERITSRVAIIVGTRPEAVKLAGIVQLLGDRAALVHTGQHFDPELAGRFDAHLGLPDPLVQLAIGGGTRDEQLDRGARDLVDVLERLAPDVVVVQGDTNSTLAGARAAAAVHLPLVHVEAGLRSFDLAMPEEHNRVETDHLSDLCLAPTAWAATHLADEGITGDRVVVTGNTAVDAVLDHLPDAQQRAAIVERFGVGPGAYVLATIHRPENTDDPDVLRTVLDGLGSLPMPVLLPVHPRTRARAVAARLGSSLERLVLLPSLDHAEFLALAAESALLVSDSGGIQEEASVLKRAVVVVRRSTERPEVEGTFARLTSPGALADAAGAWLEDLRRSPRQLDEVPSPYGDGTASSRSVAAIEALLGSQVAWGEA